MEKITLTKKIQYYNMMKQYNTDIIEKKQFTSINDALNYMKNYNLKYVINKKGISAFEELEILHQADYKTFIMYYKSINPNTLETHDNIGKHGEHEAQDEIL